MKLFVVDRYEEVDILFHLRIEMDWPEMARWLPPHLPVAFETPPRRPV